MKRVSIIAALVLVAFGGLPATPAAADPPTSAELSWELTSTGVNARLRGLSAVNQTTAWASGSAGTVLRTTDGGQTWQNVSPPDVTTLQFRDIEAFDADTAVALSIGPGDQSRVYRTTDGGTHWTLTFQNPEANAFYDCMAFFDHRHGLALSDPVDGKFRVLSTSDGGASWDVVPSAGMPPALDGEFAFAASGQCVTAFGGQHAWIATGGGSHARVLRSSDRGLTWTASVTPLASSPSAGVFAVAFRDPTRGVAVGGDFADPTNGTDALAFTGDSGVSWGQPDTAPQGYRSGLTWHPHLPTVLIAVGPTGSDVSVDGGRHWSPFDPGSFDTVDCAADGACWASGERGRVAVLRLNR